MTQLRKDRQSRRLLWYQPQQVLSAIVCGQRGGQWLQNSSHSGGGSGGGGGGSGATVGTETSKVKQSKVKQTPREQEKQTK